VLGFVKVHDIPMGEFRWLTVRAADGSETELVLEPNANPIARTYQQALLEQGIPATSFEVDDLKAEFERLRARGVEFTTPPTQAGPVWRAVLLDTCGNLIQLHQPPRS
jgi:predicted enzyme related to lactoylglutathione lyase